MPIKTNKHRPLLEDAMNAYYPGKRWYEFSDSKNKIMALSKVTSNGIKE
mgnify:CR=1 FL=1